MARLPFCAGQNWKKIKTLQRTNPAKKVSRRGVVCLHSHAPPFCGGFVLLCRNPAWGVSNLERRSVSGAIELSP
jgi:hypothetical protein